MYELNNKVSSPFLVSNLSGQILFCSVPRLMTDAANLCSEPVRLLQLRRYSLGVQFFVHQPSQVTDVVQCLQFKGLEADLQA